MASEHQLSVLSRGPLFERQVLEQYLRDLRGRGIPQEANRASAIAEWLQSLDTSQGTKETALEQSFNQKVLHDALGYALWPEPTASAWPKAPTSLTKISGEPDVLLGRFVDGEEPTMSAVLELKAPGTDLDKPQARAGGQTPVEQAFGYARGILGVRWIVLSDMRRIRLYSVESPHEAVSFDLAACCSADGRPTDSFRELWGLLSHDCLVRAGAESSVSRLLGKSVQRQLQIRDSFYEVYYLIRSALLSAIQAAVQGLTPTPDRDAVLTATQRLLDRLLFLYYCEDTPGRLLPPDTVKSVTEAARRVPGPSSTKVYDALKALFAEVDQGSPASSLQKLPAYNGELFKPDPILDSIDLPDALHDEIYSVWDGDEVRRIQGVWGLHAFDFWRELNEHLLGHIFEQSLSDIAELAAGEELTPDRLAERRRHGIYYTSELLSDALCGGSLQAILDESCPTSGARTQEDLLAKLESRRTHLQGLKVLDLACGSGAFLVSSYQALLEELWSVQDAVDSLTGAAPDLLSQSVRLDQSRLLRDTLHGVDLLPQAAEIAKLALWLRSAQKGEKVPDLSHNIVAANSLDVDKVTQLLDRPLNSFDLVVGNPPWGAEVSPTIKQAVCDKLGLDRGEDWDSFELFTALGLAFLRPGGRLAYVLPDTFFSPEKAKTRESVLRSGAIERVHDLGPDWFDDVRMGTVLLQLRKGSVPMAHVFRSILLSGDLRRKAIAGSVPLSQIETTLGRDIPQDRALESEGFEIEVFRSAVDDAVMNKMVDPSISLAELCDRGRGEEMSKAGLLWICPSCLEATVPATKRKADPRKPDAAKYNTKNCPDCGLTLTEKNVGLRHLVTPNEDADGGTTGTTVPYVDGDDITHRWQPLTPRKLLHLDLKGFGYKSEALYSAPKILVRKTGVGVLAAYDEAGLRFPQTVFFYRVKPEREHEGYRNEFVLAALLSRTMAYYVFKRFGQVDPSRGHAHVTHKRLEALPIPQVDFSDTRERQLHDEIVGLGRQMLGQQPGLGGPEDMRIERLLRELWRLSAEDGLHINLELAQVPAGQVIRDMFPAGLPAQIVRTATAKADALEAVTPTA